LSKFAEADVAAANADANAPFVLWKVKIFQELGASNTPPVLHFESGAYRLRGVIVLPDRKIEDRHDGVPNRLVEQSIVVPNRLSAFIVESIQCCAHVVRRNE
jgi:hypothetical protein